MSGLAFDPSKCVRSATKFSECRKCVEACPVETLTIAENNLPAFTPSACVDCGGCLGACPTEAFSLKDFDTTHFFFDFLEKEDEAISCRRNVPCAAVLGAEHLLAMALLRDRRVVVDVGHCQSCPYREPLYEKIVAAVEEANYLLEAIESPKRVAMEPLALEEEGVQKEEGYDAHDRRAFLQRLSLKGALATKKAFDEAVEGAEDALKTHEIDLAAVAKMRKKELPDRRKMLFVALKRAPRPSLYHTIAEGDISFASQKFIDIDTCTACQMCYRICPTGALSSDPKNSRIYFDAMMCVKCRACHDTCEPQSLRLQPTFELKEFFEPTQRLLAKFAMVRCDECGIHFPSVRGERTCPRCAVEEEEALELWGLEERDGVVVFRQESDETEKGKK
ncbi:4Fe-4S binding protein [Hydrogenimonas sp.]